MAYIEYLASQQVNSVQHSSDDEKQSPSVPLSQILPSGESLMGLPYENVPSMTCFLFTFRGLLRLLHISQQCPVL